jgi:hypothetical protein
MKKKNFLIFALTVIFILAFFIGFSSLNVDAAVCTPEGNMGTCEGECCKLTKEGCIAGPCSVILK